MKYPFAVVGLFYLTFFSSCTNEKKQIDILGGWNRTTSNYGIITLNDQSSFSGYLSSDLFVTKDSIYILNDAYFLKSGSTYQIINDSLIIHFEQPLKYKIEVTDSTLNLDGKNYYYTYEVNEWYQFVRSDYLKVEQYKKLILEKLNHNQLEHTNWSLKPINNIEVITDYHKCTFEKYDTSLNIFPDTIKFRETDLHCFEPSKFKMETDTFKIVDFNMSVLTLERTFNRKRYRITYEDCSYLYPYD